MIMDTILNEWILCHMILTLLQEKISLSRVCVLLSDDQPAFSSLINRICNIVSFWHVAEPFHTLHHKRRFSPDENLHPTVLSDISSTMVQDQLVQDPHS
jgi:hypothetical protein